MESLLYVQEMVQFLMRVKGHDSHLFFMAVCASVESSRKKKILVINKAYVEEALQQWAGLNQALLHGR